MRHKALLFGISLLFVLSGFTCHLLEQGKTKVAMGGIIDEEDAIISIQPSADITEQVASAEFVAALDHSMTQTLSRDLQPELAKVSAPILRPEDPTARREEAYLNDADLEGADIARQEFTIAEDVELPLTGQVSDLAADWLMGNYESLNTKLRATAEVQAVHWQAIVTRFILVLFAGLFLVIICRHVFIHRTIELQPERRKQVD